MLYCVFITGPGHGIQMKSGRLIVPGQIWRKIQNRKQTGIVVVKRLNYGQDHEGLIKDYKTKRFHMSKTTCAHPFEDQELKQKVITQQVLYQFSRTPNSDTYQNSDTVVSKF